jgi:sugar phosphate isomerase/epimerase
VHYSELGGVLSDLGVDGCDLTVRPGGHVEPALSAADMYRAVEAIRGEHIEIPMISTAFVNPSDPTMPNVLALCGGKRMKVPFFVIGNFPYGPGGDINAHIAQVRRDVAGLISFGRAYEMSVAFPNRSGNFVGEAIWDAHAVMGDFDAASIGYYFDLCEATIEGGDAGWNIALRLIERRLKAVAVQDFAWAKVNGKWMPQRCPLGEGMVDWPQALTMLAAANFTGPLSLHVEYGQTGELSAIGRDLAYLKKQVAAAYGTVQG